MPSRKKPYTIALSTGGRERFIKVVATSEARAIAEVFKKMPKALVLTTVTVRVIPEIPNV